MGSDTPAPTGAARRRRRLSDEETEQRMLSAALDMVNSAGLTVSLDHISFEDVIRDAGVSRSAVYRRWPYKDLFFSDLLKALARGASPAIGGGNADAVENVRQIMLDHLDWLRTPDTRRALAAEVLRQGARSEFETFHRSAEWRTYFALQATFLSLPAGDLRTEVEQALAASDAALNTRVAAAYQRVTELIGLRLRPELGTSFHDIATLATAIIRGLVVMAPANPDITARHVHANPFAAPDAADWSQPALGMAAVVMTFVEPDPAVTWDDDRIAAVRATLESPTWTMT